MKQKLLKLIAPAALLGVTALPVLTATPAQAAPAYWHHHWYRHTWHRPVWHRPVWHRPVWHRSSINARQRYQQRRILQGERHSSLTYGEANRLERRTGRINAIEARDRRSGGRFTPTERHQVQRDLNHQSRAIYHQKHDRQHR